MTIAGAGGAVVVLKALSCLRVRLTCAFNTPKPAVEVAYLPPPAEALDPGSPLRLK